MKKRILTLFVIISMFATLMPATAVYAESDESPEATYQFETKNIVGNGNGCEDIIFVIAGDGFTSSEQQLFESKAEELADYILDTEPFSDLKENISFYCIDVISEESGSGNGANDLKNTFFKTYYNIGRIDRLISSKKSFFEIKKLFSNYVPYYDYGLLLVNDTRYGGSGGSISIASINSKSYEIMLHEMGHSIANLADEYWYADAAYEHINMTKESDPEKVPWADLIGEDGIGVYPYDGNSEWYRPSLNCKMEYLGKNHPFCAVCKRAIKKSLESKMEHDLHTDKEVAPTCTATGITEGSHCDVCGKIIKAQETIPATGHSMTAHPEVPATYTANGTALYWTCLNCGKMFSDEQGENEISDPVLIPKLAKKTQPVKVITSTKSVKAKKLKKKARTVKPLTVKGYKGTVSYKITGGNAKAKKALSINKKTGKITVKKKTAKGTYTVKVKVSVTGTDMYKTFSKTVSVTVKVK